VLDLYCTRRKPQMVKTEVAMKNIGFFSIFLCIARTRVLQEKAFYLSQAEQLYV